MKQAVFYGAATALITPMHPDGSIYFEELRRLIDWQIEEGIDALVLCGTTGECATLSQKEHLKVLSCAIEQVNGRIPVIAGSGSNDTAFSMVTSREAASLGADALMSVTPYYNKTTQEGLIRHFTAIAESAGLPLILYNVPSRTGMDLSVETCKTLSAHPLIAGIKEASGDVAKAERIIASCGEDLPVYSGNDDIAAPILAVGGKGVVSVLSNLLPGKMRNLCRCGLKGEMAVCREMQLQLLPMMDALFAEVNPIPIKKAMNLAGWQAGPCRLPLVDPSDVVSRQLIETMLHMGIAVKEGIGNGK